MNWTFYPLSTLPAPYDIIWCRFPKHSDLGKPGPKPRPAIVLNVAAHDAESWGEVQLIYGTTNLKMMRRMNDFYITNLREMSNCGLDKATRFDLDTVSWIPWADEWFETLPTYTSPVIGHLTNHAQTLLQRELAYKQAERHGD